MRRFIHVLKSGFPLGVAITFLSGLIYLSAQQVLRHLANDPQIQIAEEIAAARARGEIPEALPAWGAPAGSKSDMSHSLAPFVIEFDDQLQPTASTVQLDGQTPAPPPGVFEHAKSAGENRLTWQPRPGVRNATVVVHYGGPHPGFVLAGRSLRESEARTAMIGKLIGVGWIASMFALSVISSALAFVGGRAQPAV